MGWYCIFFDALKQIDQCIKRMNRIQLVDLDTSSDEGETGGVVISKHKMWSRLGWFTTKVVPQMKQKAERTDTIGDVEKIHEVVWIQGTQESQPGNILAPLDALEVMEEIKDDCGEMNKEQENIKEKIYHIDDKEESLTKSSTSLIEIQ